MDSCASKNTSPVNFPGATKSADQLKNIMGDAILITLEHEIPDFDATVTATALAQSVDALVEVADLLNVRPLGDFLGQTEEDMASFMGSEDGELDDDLDDDTWFDASEGLNTVRSMIDYFAEHPGEADEGVVADLTAFEKVLARADEHHIRWQLEFDF
jgi:hypothetical protein